MQQQREMPLLGKVRKPEQAPLDLVKNCRHRLDAIRLCVQLSTLSHQYICSELGIDKGHFSRVMQGRAHFPDAKSVELMHLCGNFAPLQYEAWACGFDLQERAKDARIQELEAELAKLRGVA
jgi:hypothetical protein